MQYIDRISFKLKDAFSFDFMNKYGTVFKVYADQDSGNICFGTDKDGQRYFIKFAGVPTVRYNGNSADAIARLTVFCDIRWVQQPSLVGITVLGTSGSSATNALRSQRKL